MKMLSQNEEEANLPKNSQRYDQSFEVNLFPHQEYVNNLNKTNNPSTFHVGEQHSFINEKNTQQVQNANLIFKLQKVNHDDDGNKSESKHPNQIVDDESNKANPFEENSKREYKSQDEILNSQTKIKNISELEQNQLSNLDSFKLREEKYQEQIQPGMIQLSGNKNQKKIDSKSYIYSNDLNTRYNNATPNKSEIYEPKGNQNINKININSNRLGTQKPSDRKHILSKNNSPYTDIKEQSNLNLEEQKLEKGKFKEIEKHKEVSKFESCNINEHSKNVSNLSKIDIVPDDFTSKINLIQFSTQLNQDEKDKILNIFKSIQENIKGEKIIMHSLLYIFEGDIEKAKYFVYESMKKIIPNNNHIIFLKFLNSLYYLQVKNVF